MDRGIPVEVSDGSKERTSRCWGTPSGSICEPLARYGNKGFFDNYDRNGDPTP